MSNFCTIVPDGTKLREKGDLPNGLSENFKSKGLPGSEHNPYKLGEKGSGIRSQGAVQDFNQLREKCLSAGILFEDPEFPADDSSIFTSERPEKFENGIVWKRPGNGEKYHTKDGIVDNPRLFLDGASRFDVVQGHFGNCWMVAAVANIAKNQKVLDQVIPGDQECFNKNYAGIFRFRFWQFGKWVEVVIDDRLPTYDGKLIGIHSSNNNEFWSSLLEKAYAKLHGSWQSLEGGCSSQALEDLTGGISQKFKIKYAPSDLFDILLDAYKKKAIICCSISKPIDGSPEEKELKKLGLTPIHAYSVTKVMYLNGELINRVEDIPMMRIRNPWGCVEWKGAWNDESPEWKSINDQEKERIHFKSRDDGEFWMTFNDWKKYYTKYEICYLNPVTLMTKNIDNDAGKNWQISAFEGEWIPGVSSGGKFGDSKKFQHNPQYLLTLGEESTVIVALMQKNRRTQRQDCKDFLSIGYHIYKLPNKELPRPLDQTFFEKNKLLDIGKITDNKFTGRVCYYYNYRQVNYRMKLKSGIYCIIPSNGSPEKTAEFLLRVFSEKPIKMEEYDVQVGICDVEEKIIARSDNDKDMQKLRKIFRNNSGNDWELDWSEYRNLISIQLKKEMYEQGFSDDAYRSMIALLDSDNSGKIGYHEFQKFWKNVKIWMAAFEKHDETGTKILKPFKLKQVLKSAGYSLNHRVLNSLQRRYGTEDGQIKFSDYFMSALRLNKMIGAYEDLLSSGLIASNLTLELWLRTALNFS